MTTVIGSGHAMHAYAPASLRELASYLEVALAAGKAVVVMRHGTSGRSVFIGNPSSPLEDMVSKRVVAAYLADGMLTFTEPGVNQTTVDDRAYRFMQSHRCMADQHVVNVAPI